MSKEKNNRDDIEELKDMLKEIYVKNYELSESQKRLVSKNMQLERNQEEIKNLMIKELKNIKNQLKSIRNI